MSFSFTVTLHAGDSSRDRFFDLWDRALSEQLGLARVDDRTTPGHDVDLGQALRAARKSAKILVSALGGEWARVDVKVVGHVNPGNQPVDGWSPDFVNVAVNIVEYLPAALRTPVPTSVED